MNKPIAIAILVVGVVLLLFGLNAHDSLFSGAKQAVTGTPTNQSLWLIVGGIACICVGGFGSLNRGSGR